LTATRRASSRQKIFIDCSRNVGEAVFSFLKAEEFFTQRIFVRLLGRLHFVADFVFFEVRVFPFVDVSNRMID